MLNPIHLRTLTAVMHTGSFAAAAKHLGYTSSAVSQQMSALENDANLVLFERTARAIRPTRAADLLVQRAAEVLAMLDSLEDQVEAMAGGRLGRLRIGSFPTASQHLVPEALARLAQRLPDLEIVLDENEPNVLLPLVSEREIDLALVYEYDLVPRRWPRNLQCTPLLAEDLVLLLPARHEHAGSVLELGNLENDVWISTAEGTSGAECLQRACGSVGFVPRIDYRTNDYDVVRRLVAAGLGIALVPALGDEESEGVVTGRMPALGLQRRVIAVYRRVGAHPAVDEALGACRRAAARLVDEVHLHRP